MQIVREIPPAANSLEELRSERLFESVHDTIRFERLLETAERLCLRETPHYPEYSSSVDNEAKLIDRVGTLGVRYALESTWGREMGLNRLTRHFPTLCASQSFIQDLLTADCSRKRLHLARR